MHVAVFEEAKTGLFDEHEWLQVVREVVLPLPEEMCRRRSDALLEISQVCTSLNVAAPDPIPAPFVVQDRQPATDEGQNQQAAASSFQPPQLPQSSEADLEAVLTEVCEKAAASKGGSTLAAAAAAGAARSATLECWLDHASALGKDDILQQVLALLNAPLRESQ